MRTFNKRVDLFRESPTRKIDKIKEEEARRGKDIILLSTGQPSIPPPRRIRELLARDLLEESSRLYSYTPTRGYASLIEAIVEDMKYFGVELEPEQVTATAGGQSALFAAITSLVEPGDEVVVLDPMYFGYWPLLDYAGAKVKTVTTTFQEGFQPDPERLKEAVSSRTKMIIVVTPDNPTGRVLGLEAAKTIADLAVEYGFWILVDEAYRTLVYEGEHVYIYNLAPEHTVALNAFSKDPGIPGWRLGFAYGPLEAIRRIRLVVQETVYCPPSPAQRLVEYYLRDRDTRLSFMEYLRREYTKRRDTLLKALEEHLPEVVAFKPQGGMFVFADFTPLLKGMTAEELAVRLLREEGVAVVPGSYFSQTHKGSIRLSFSGEPPERLRLGVEKIASFLRRTG